ncbi:MAG: hypothetical protein WC860_03695 [Candidatus Margulisiibacteriota bacterium]|jgi:hypothetical protein
MQKIIFITLINGIGTILWSLLTSNFLFRWFYNLEPIDIWKPFYEFPYFVNYVWLILLSFSFVLIFSVICKNLPGNFIYKGFIFGLIMWGVSVLSLISLLMFTVINAIFLLFWVINLLIIFLFQGLVISYFQKN